MSGFSYLARAFLLAVGLCAATGAFAGNDEYERLTGELDRLATDPELGQLATAQMDRARAALADLKEAGRRERESLAYVAERRIAIARTTAQAEQTERQRDALQRENDRLQLAIAQRDAAQARAELDRQRMQAQIRAEEAERARQDAEAARIEGEQAVQAARDEAAQAKRVADAQTQAATLAKKEAALATAINSSSAAAGPKAATGSKTAAASAGRMALSENIFGEGQSTLAAGVSAQIAKAAAFVNADASKRVRIDVSAGGNKALAQQRAQAVRNALVGAGVDAKRITATGTGDKGKRVEMVLQ
jgi:outer membrane protein OmpA-like peptidoglycan-associated protein